MNELTSVSSFSAPGKSVKTIPITPLHFTSLFNKCRVTCVKYIDKFIFAGVGDVLRIYDFDSQELHFKKQIILGQNIYGICLRGFSSEIHPNLVIWGGKRLYLAALSFHPTVDVCDEETWADNAWIWDVSWLNTELFIALVMNNSAVLWNSKLKCKLATAFCDEQCILYSGKIIGNTWEETVILAGTVMQDILIWKPKRDGTVCHTLHALKGHKGAIFSVNYSSVSRLIVSTSDDRSVRIWQVCFGEIDDWTSAKISCISTIYGHTARIWQSVILISPEYKGIVSIGEDGLLCIWTLDGSTNIMRQEAHQSGSICSVDANMQAGLIVTGGIDGGLCQWFFKRNSKVEAKCFTFDLDLRPICPSGNDEKFFQKEMGSPNFCDNSLNSSFKKFTAFPSSSSSDFNLNAFKSSLKYNDCASSNNNSICDIANENLLSDQLDLEKNDVPDERRVSSNPSSTYKPPVLRSLFLSKNGSVICAAEGGFLVGLSLRSSKWTLLFSDQRFASYHLLSASKSRNFLSLASICGIVLLFKDISTETDLKLSLISEVKVCCTKIFSLNWLKEESFITCVENGLLELWKVTTDGHSESEVKVSKEYESTLPPSKERWLTSSAYFDVYLLCGDRSGSLHVYCLNSSQNIMQTFKRIHNGGVCDIQWNKATGEAYSIGRDCYLRHWILKNKQLELILTEKLPIKWPTKIFLSHSFGIIVFGFTASHAVVWSYVERKVLLTQECGGGHRSWDCLLEDSLTLIWIKDKSVFCRHLPINSLSKPAIMEGFHTKEINAVACCRSFSKSHQPFIFLISGSEDTNLRVSSCSLSNLSSQLGFLQHLVLRSHVSSIRALVAKPWAPENKSDCSKTVDSNEWNEKKHLIVSAGGRAQLKVWALTSHFNKIDRMHELASHMLRGDDKSRKPGTFDSIDPEARYMAVDVVSVTEELAFIFTACSDGIIRIFRFINGIKELGLEVEIEYHEACLLGLLVKEINKKSTSLLKSSECIMLTMDTNGSVAVWKIIIEYSNIQINRTKLSLSSKSKPLFVFSAHQSGINSYDLKSENNSFLLATGGDDTAITLSCFNLTTSALKEQCTFNNAHEAQVSGLSFLKNDSWLLSASGDQRIILWRYESNPNLTLQIIGEYQSVVADIHGLSVLDSNDCTVCVYGCGLEILHVDLKEIRTNFNGLSQR